MTLAKVVRGGSGGWLEACTVLTVMVGAGAGLRVEHGCRWCGLAVSPCVFRRALTFVIVYAVDASSTVLKKIADLCHFYSLGLLNQEDRIERR